VTLILGNLLLIEENRRLHVYLAFIIHKNGAVFAANLTKNMQILRRSRFEASLEMVSTFVFIVCDDGYEILGLHVWYFNFELARRLNIQSWPSLRAFQAAQRQWLLKHA